MDENIQKPFDINSPPKWTLDTISKYNNFYVYNRFQRKEYIKHQDSIINDTENIDEINKIKKEMLKFEDDIGQMNIHCPCTRHILRSPCKRLFYSAAGCHNRAIVTAKAKNSKPLLEACDTYFFHLHKCMLRNNVPIHAPE